MREEIAILAGENWRGNRKSWLTCAADALAEYGSKVSRRMVKTFFYAETVDDKHWAAIEIRRVAKIVKAQREAEALALQFETIVSRLNVTDPDFHQPTVDALRGAARQLRGEDRPGNSRSEVKLGFDPPQ